MGRGIGSDSMVLEDVSERIKGTYPKPEHTAVYINSWVVFTKNGWSRENAFEFDEVENVLGFYWETAKQAKVNRYRCVSVEEYRTAGPLPLKYLAFESELMLLEGLLYEHYSGAVELNIQERKAMQEVAEGLMAQGALEVNFETLSEREDFFWRGLYFRAQSVSVSLVQGAFVRKSWWEFWWIF
ncbi:MAG: hypothetical protein AB1540_02260 [Bdellovibrionota bacterium]